MRPSVVSVLAAATMVSAQSSTMPAPKINNSAVASYVATIPVTAGSPVGSISAVTAPDGVGVKFSVAFTNLDAYMYGAPFMYHIHDKPVAANGSCASAGAHLDPYKRGEVPVCDASKPETCQTGDLSGKYGNFSTASFSAEYVDPYSSTDPSSNAYFGNLSFVLHLANKTRIACANFQKVGGYPTGNSSTTPSPTGSPTKPSSVSPPIATFTGAAAKIAGGTGAMLAAVVALAL